MLDNNGAFTYSNILGIRNERNNNLSILSNPVKNSLSVSHDKAEINAYINICTLDGKTIVKQKSAAYSTQELVGVANLTPGIYVLIYMNGSTVSSIRFMKQ